MSNYDPTFVLRGTQIRFSPLGGPLDEAPASLFFADLGYALAAWARMEHMLTCLALHVNKVTASPALHQEDPNTKFSELVKLLRKWISKHHAYANVRSPSDPKFFESLLEMARFRNELVHGSLNAIDEKSGEFHMLQIQRTGRNQWKAKNVTYKIEGLKLLADLSNLAHRHFVELGKAIFEKENEPSP